MSGEIWAAIDLSGLIDRLQGPYHLRFLLQPMVAAISAVRAARRDVREGRSPYLWRMVMRPGHRAAILREGWRGVRSTFELAVVVDFVYQWSVQGWVDPVGLLLTATLLAILPYLLVRGPVARLVRAVGPPPARACRTSAGVTTPPATPDKT